MKALLAATSAAGLETFYSGLAGYLVDHGCSVDVIGPLEDMTDQKFAREGARKLHIQIERDPSPRSDIAALLRLIRVMRAGDYDVVILGSPKISLLGSFACRVTGTRAIYCVHGLRYQGATGAKRRMLISLERLTTILASRTVCVGNEIMAQARADGAIGAAKVLANGSANGYAPPEICTSARANLGAPAGGIIFGFVARITRDKGVYELIHAWRSIARDYPGSTLLVAGKLENDLSCDPEVRQFLADESVLWLGHQDDVSVVFSAIDVLLLPSYREGLPTVVLEAGSYGKPSVVANSTGTSEPVVDGVTGIVINVRDASSIEEALRRILRGDIDYRKMGIEAKKWVEGKYSRDRLYPHWLVEVRSVAVSSRHDGQ